MRYLLLALMFLGACSLNPVYRAPGHEPHVMMIDVSRYVGRWYEQARLPNSFESDCVKARADYASRADGNISVVNTCTTGEGRERVARGEARTTGAGGEGKLEVSFFKPFWAPYWVLARADDYSWSIVGEGDGRYLWLLTRAETITPAQRQALEARIAALGYPLAALVWRDHTRPERSSPSG